MKENYIQELNAKAVIQGIKDQQISRKLVPEFHDIYGQRKKLDKLFGEHKVDVLFEYHFKNK